MIREILIAPIAFLGVDEQSKLSFSMVSASIAEFANSIREFFGPPAPAMAKPRPLCEKGGLKKMLNNAHINGYREDFNEEEYNIGLKKA